MSVPRNFCPDCGDTHSRTELDAEALLELLRECGNRFEAALEFGLLAEARAGAALVANGRARHPDLLVGLRSFESYFDSRADYDLQGTPSQFVPNDAARLLHEVRVAIHSVELVSMMEGRRT